MFITKCTGAPVQETDEFDSERTSQKPHLIEYSVSVPTDELYSQLQIMDYFPPHQGVRKDLRPNVRNRYIVPLMSLQVHELEGQGIDLELPTRRSFSDEHWLEATSNPNSTLTLLQKLRAETYPDEPVEVGYNFPAPRMFKSGGHAFCPYDDGTSSKWCPPGNSIEEQLDELENMHSPTYFQRIEIGESQRQKRRIYAVRLGKITEDTDNPSPALFYIATQHAREWLAAEIAMRLIHYTADEIRTNPSGDIAKLLQDRTLVIVPVANPDGYQHSHDKYDDDRLWRKNRRYNEKPGCEEHHGVDMNRNYQVAFGQPHSYPNCSSPQYHGPAPFSESETDAIKNLVAGTLDAPWGPRGSYTPIVALDVHTYGNMVLFSPGLGVSAHGVECRTPDNCGNPDFGILRALFGSQDSISSPYSPSSPQPFFQDPYWTYNHYGDDDWEDDNKKPVRWPIGTGHRTAYPSGGSLKDELTKGEFPDRKPNPIAATVEISWMNEVGMKPDWPGEFSPAFWAEYFDLGSNYWDPLTDNQAQLVEYLLDLLHDLDVENGTFYPNYTRGVIERRCYGGQTDLGFDKERCWSENEPAYYKGVRNTIYNKPEDVEITPPSGYNGNTREDLKGRTHDLFQWNQENSYEFPPTITVCIKGDACDTDVLDEGDGPVKLCDQDLFPNSGQYFDGFPSCRWILDGAVGTYIERKKVSLKHRLDTRLQYSYKEGKGTKVKVYIESRSKRRLVRKHPRNHPGVYRSDVYKYFKTEVVSAWDFSGDEDVSVVFEVETQGSEPFIVGDVIFISAPNP